MPHYTVVPFEGFPKANEANDHSWTIGNKSRTAAFSVYDKTYELAVRHEIDIEDHILRLELRIERKRIRQLAPKGSWEDQLRELIKQGSKQMDKFLHRLHQDIGAIVTDEAAFQMIESSSFRTKAKEAMCKAVGLTQKCETLVEVRKKMKMSRKKFKGLLGKFRKIGINPLTRTDEEKS